MAGPQEDGSIRLDQWDRDPAFPEGLMDRHVYNRDEAEALVNALQAALRGRYVTVQTLKGLEPMMLVNI